MNPLRTAYLGTLLVSTVISLSLAVVFLRKRSRTEMVWFAGVLGAATVWSVGQIVGAVAWNFRSAAAAHATIYFGVAWTVLFFLLFALEYTDNEAYVTARGVAVLSIHPLVVTVAAWSNPLHEFLWQGRHYAPAELGHIDLVGRGVLFQFHFAYSYGLMLVAVGLLVRMALRREDLYRGQIVAIAAGAVVPLAVNALYFADVLPADLTSSSFVVTGAAVLVATRRYGFSSLTPVARETVLDNMNAGTFVLDEDDRIIDVNPAGRRLLGGDREDPIGTDLETALDSLPDLYDRYADLREGTDEVTIDVGGSVRHYRVDVTPLSNDRDETVGRLFVVRDVTDRTERERELERQNEQLDRFASLVSHDLRNPLNVADGYVEMVAEAAEPPATEYAAEIAESHDRMRRIIEDVLTMARKGQTITDVERVDLGPLARRAWSNVDTGDATLTVDLGIVVEGDPDRLLHVFENLFRNAVEHGGEGVDVTVGQLQGCDGSVVDLDRSGFFVADDGPGIPEDRREEVFEAGHTTHEAGTGLGLSIVEQFVEAHGWEIAVTESEAGGARFEVTGVPTVEDANGDVASAAATDGGSWIQ